jgi:hypothetical protein
MLILIQVAVIEAGVPGPVGHWDFASRADPTRSGAAGVIPDKSGRANGLDPGRDWYQTPLLSRIRLRDEGEASTKQHRVLADL